MVHLVIEIMHQQLSNIVFRRFRMEFIKIKYAVTLASSIVLASVSGVSFAKLTAEELAKLGVEGTELTPAGAIRAGNAEGTIPEWKNKAIVPPASFKAGDYHPDPFADDKVLFKITASNYKEYADKLTAGQQHMFETYPDHYMNIYQTRRPAVFNKYITDSALKNAAVAEVTQGPTGGLGFTNARAAWAFPIPKNGNEALLNFITRPVNPGLSSYQTTVPVTSTGSYIVNVLTADTSQKWSDPEATDFDQKVDGLRYYQTIVEPAKAAGQVLLIRDPQEFSTTKRKAWLYSPGQRRVKRAPQVLYDNPWTAGDGLATNDQKFGYNGPTDRYNWTLVGRKEMYVPYNAYKMHGVDATAENLVTEEGRIDQEFARYELHRVWVVEGHLKEGTNHIYGRRTFFFDEDSWWVVASDNYDRRGNIWRLWESHDVMYYDVGFMAVAAAVQYDMQAGRMIYLGYDKRRKLDLSFRAPEKYFTPATVRRDGKR